MDSTFYVTDSAMLNHRCEWDSTHIEIPERLAGIIERISSSGLETQCTRLSSRLATEKEILSVHTQKYFETIKTAAEQLCTTFEDLYLNEHSYNSAMLSAGCALTALEAVLKTSGSNGFAAIRPPGHHAAPDRGCGFCIFNNVAICAKAARKQGIEKVLIIDWDVHAGQGTQYCIEDDPGIKLVSIHRYEDGCFWPNLPESGIEQPYSNTINVPLDVPGYGNFEYAAFIDVFVRPIISDFNPNLILVSCGYDAGFGDREGEMRVTPAGYAQMTGTLASLGIPLLLLLEGGYFIDALPFHAERTIEALIKRKPLCLPLALPNETPKLKNNFIELLFTSMKHHLNEFPSLKAVLNCANVLKLANFDRKIEKYRGTRELEYPFPTRNVYPVFSELEKFQQELYDIILPAYDKPVEKEQLEICLNNKNDAINIFNRSDADAIPIVTFVPSAKTAQRSEEILFFYHLVYLPLCWVYSLEPWKTVLEVFDHVFVETNSNLLQINVSTAHNTVLNSMFF